MSDYKSYEYLFDQHYLYQKHYENKSKVIFAHEDDNVRVGSKRYRAVNLEQYPPKRQKIAASPLSYTTCFQERFELSWQAFIHDYPMHFSSQYCEQVRRVMFFITHALHTFQTDIFHRKLRVFCSLGDKKRYVFCFYQRFVMVMKDECPEAVNYTFPLTTNLVDFSVFYTLLRLAQDIASLSLFKWTYSLTSNLRPHVNDILCVSLEHWIEQIAS